MADGKDANELDVALSVGEVTVLVWLVDLAAEEGRLPDEAADLWVRTRERLSKRVEAVVSS